MSEELTIRPFIVKETVDGKELEKNLAIRKPSGQEGIEAGKIYSKAWNEAFNSRALLRCQVEKELVERGIWSEEKERDLNSRAKDLQKEIERLGKGGMKLEDAKDLAFNIRNMRYEFNQLALEKNVLDNNTVEGQAEIARINYLISVCTVYNYGSKGRVYKSLEEFYNSSNDKTAIEATNNFMSFVYNMDSDYAKKYPENEFLVKYKFVDSEHLLPLNEDGKTYDPETKWLVNEFGQWVDEAGALINRDGQLVNEDGTLKFESAPFTDGDGNPVE